MGSAFIPFSGPASLIMKELMNMAIVEYWKKRPNWEYNHKHRFSERELIDAKEVDQSVYDNLVKDLMDSLVRERKPTKDYISFWCEQPPEVVIVIHSCACPLTVYGFYNRSGPIFYTPYDPDTVNIITLYEEPWAFGNYIKNKADEWNIARRQGIGE